MTTKTKFRLRRLTGFSLRTGLVAITVFGIWLGLHLRSVKQQRASVEAVHRIGGEVWYDYQTRGVAGTFDSSAESFVPGWLLKVAGRDHFHDVVTVIVHNYRNLGETESPKDADWLGTCLVGVPHLTRLSIVDQTTGDTELQAISRLKHLRVLYIGDGSEITDRGVLHLQKLKRLNNLDMRSPKITDESLLTLSVLPGLRHLTLTNSEFTGEGLRYAGKMSQLQWLVIVKDADWASDADLANLRGLSNLETLALGGSEFTEEGMQHLSPLKNLKSLLLTGSDIDPGWLSEQLPQCKIVVANRTGGQRGQTVWHAGAKQ